MNMEPLFTTSKHHPVLVTAQADASSQGLCDYLVTNRAQMHRLLLQHGGILFRGFRLEGAEGFKACAESLGAQPFDYVGGNSPRSRVAADVYTSTEYPASEVISLHNEMSYLPQWPRRLFFYSVLPAIAGGQTSLANGGDVLRALPAQIVAKLRDKKINYIRNFQSSIPLGKSWQVTYATENKAEVETIVRQQGSICKWLPAGALRVSTLCEAVAAHPHTGEQVWFNQAEQWHPSALKPALRGMFEEMVGKGQLPHDCEYGDGEPLEEDVLMQIRRALDSCKLLFDWQRNDLLMIDNVLMMHGRESFKGDRKTLAYLSST